MPTQTKFWKNKKATFEKGDIEVTDGKPTDVVVVVIGPTGVGKSTFINAFFNENVTTIGHDLESCTTTMKPVVRPHPIDRTRRLVVVDTPGFNSTDMDDTEVLRRISVWLATSYTSNMKIAGVIYLHEITCDVPASKYLAVCRKLCGDDALSSLILGTTKWSQVPTNVGDSRLEKLKSKFWSDMIAKGSVVYSFDNTQESAMKMIYHLLTNKQNLDHVQLQTELVDQEKKVPDTEAGLALRYSLEDIERMKMSGLHGKAENKKRRMSYLKKLFFVQR